MKNQCLPRARALPATHLFPEDHRTTLSQRHPVPRCVDARCSLWLHVTVCSTIDPAAAVSVIAPTHDACVVRTFLGDFPTCFPSAGDHPVPRARWVCAPRAPSSHLRRHRICLDQRRPCSTHLPSADYVTPAWVSHQWVAACSGGRFYETFPTW